MKSNAPDIKGSFAAATVAGTPDIVVDEIRRWHDAIGFDEVCLIFATGREATTQDALKPERPR